jgi:hypothetical protein
MKQPVEEFEFVTQRDMAFLGIKQILERYSEIDNEAEHDHGMEVARALFGEKYLNEYLSDTSNDYQPDGENDNPQQE